MKPAPFKKLKSAGQAGPFIFDPFSQKRERGRGEAEAQGPPEWVCGETATVEIEVGNPTAVSIRVRPVLLIVKLNSKDLQFDSEYFFSQETSDLAT